MHVFLSVVISPVCPISLLRAVFAAQLLLSPICGVGEQGNAILQARYVYEGVPRNHLNRRGDLPSQLRRKLENASDSIADPGRLVGKSPGYVETYVRLYRSIAKERRVKSSVVGCLTQSAITTFAILAAR